MAHQQKRTATAARVRFDVRRVARYCNFRAFIGFFALVLAGFWAGYHVTIRRQAHRTSAAVDAVYCDSKLIQLGVKGGDQHTLNRRHLYSQLATDLSSKGLQLGGTITQGLSQADLFSIIPVPATQRLLVKPRLRHLHVPVRAVIAPFSDPEASQKLHAVVTQHLLPLLQDDLIWIQNHTKYHATLIHASSHQKPVAASAQDVELEAAAVERVAYSMCPLRVVLDRVVATSGGVVMACWQVISGSEPEDLRAALQSALPHPPPNGAQAVKQPVMLHTTLARLLKGPASRRWQQHVSAVALAEGARAMTRELCGLEVGLRHVEFVEESDLLALALDGAYRVVRQVPLQCKSQLLDDGV